jgi:putative ABC transport system ATP-binding protein
VAIARALVNRPSVLLADEPTGALDTATGDEIGELLAGLNAAGQTLVLVTHNPDLAAAYARRIIQITDGRITSDTRAPGADGAHAVGAHAAGGQAVGGASTAVWR